MIEYPLATPSAERGLYLLKNSQTGKVYVGRSVDLRRRYAEWKSVFSNGLGAKNKDILAEALSTGAENWTFAVLARMPNATDKELEQAEQLAITKVGNMRPNDILNKVVSPTPHEVAPMNGNTRKSRVLAADGSEMTYPQAAAARGVTRQTIKKKLAKLREAGVFEISLEKL